MAVQPIKPSQVIKKKTETMPDGVLEAFNELIVKYFHNGYSGFKQDEVAALVASKLDITESEVYANHYLDVEGIYRKAGWTVKYDKPGYNESYDATFEFSKKRN